MNNVLKLIKNTPIVNIVVDGISINCKCEFLLPGGSIKDRSALECINIAKSKGILRDGQIVAEMTSGNMGAGLSIVCKAFGHPFIAFMSEGNSPQRKIQIEKFGARVVLVPQVDGSPGQVTGNDIKLASDTAIQYAINNNAYYVDQFNNEGSIVAHYINTGKEIIDQLGDQTEVFACCVGSSGSFTGISKRLKEFSPKTKCFVIEPAGCEVLNGNDIAKPRHILQGSGYGIIPPKFQRSLCDGFTSVTDEESQDMRSKLSMDHGLYVGYTAAANVVGCIKLAKLLGANKGITTLLCDSGFKYE